MPKDQSFNSDVPFSENKEQLILELAGLKSQLSINEQVIRDQAMELSRLKSLLDQHTVDNLKEPKEAQWFLKTFENHPDAIVISRVQDGRIERVNPAFLNLFGYSQAEVIGRSSIDLNMIEKSDRQQIISKFKTGEPVYRVQIDIRTNANALRRASLAIIPIEIGPDALIMTIIQDITESHRSEQALRESELRQKKTAELMEAERDRLAAVLDNLPVGVWIADQDGQLIKKNKAADQIWCGNAPLIKGIEDYHQYAAWDSISGKRLEQKDYPVAKALQTGCPVRPVELNIRRFDGTKGTLLVSAAPILDPQDQLTGVVGINVDISERKQVERGLADQNELLQAVFDHIPVMLVIWDPRLQRFALNHYTESLLGWTTADANDGEFMTKVYPDPAYRAEVSTYMLSVAPEWREWNVATKNGGYLPSAWTNIRLTDDRMIGIGLDLTERRQSEKALRESEERYRLVNQATNDIIWDWDLKTDSTVWNEAVEEAVGRLRAQMPKAMNGWIDHIHPDDRDRVVAGIQRAIDKGETTWSDEYRFGPFDGPWRTFIDRGLIARDAEGKAYRMIGSMLDLSERKQTEQALRESEYFYRQTLESIPGMVFTTRPDGYCDYQSQQWVDYTGVPMGEHLGDGWNKLLHTEDQPRTLAAWQSTVEGKEPYDLEYRIRRHDGVYEWFKVTARPILDKEGKVARWFGVAMNIESFKKAEAELENSRVRTAWVLKQVGVGTWFTNIPFGKLNWDEQTRQLFFVPPDVEPTIDMFWKHLHVEDHESTRLAAKKAISKKMEYRIEHRAVNPETGEFRWVRTIGHASYAPDGTPTRFDGINYDITEQKMAENALKESERKYRRLIETAHEGIWVIDRENKTSFVNEKIAQMLGCTKEELYGTSLFAFVGLEEESAAQNYIQRRRQDIAEQHDFKFRRKDGTVFWALVSTNPIFDDSGAYLGALGMISDITDRKQAEDTLLRLNEILDQKVAERTTLANKRARLLQSLAIELIETEEKERERISQLLHEDLQQLLASAKMHLQVAQETLRPNNLLSYIESLLEESISKSRNLAQELSPPILNHSTLVESLNWLSGRMHEQFGLHAELCADRINDFANSPLKIFIFRSVQELLYNVVKHSGENTAKVDLSIAESDLMVRVSDKGKGFDPNILNGAKSSGLGLVSLRERVHYMGGTFSVEGAAGQGCCITLILPIDAFTEQSQQATDGENLSECFSASTKRKGMKIRVLIVDDHNVMRKGLVKLISSQKGIQVVGEASDGQQGIELARQLVPDLILMDISMPLLDGIAATRIIKTEMPNVQVIGLSMFEDELMVQSMIRAGAKAFVSKASSTSDLVEAIYEAFRGNDMP